MEQDKNGKRQILGIPHKNEGYVKAKPFALFMQAMCGIVLKLRAAYGTNADYRSTAVLVCRSGKGTG